MVMATGYEGSTLVAELNRLANSGTYPARTEFLEEAAAACAWAGLSRTYETVHALNIKAGRTDPKTFTGLNAVCNELASTTNKSAVSALRSIDL
jgi:hypothetical protein